MFSIENNPAKNSRQKCTSIFFNYFVWKKNPAERNSRIKKKVPRSSQNNLLPPAAPRHQRKQRHLHKNPDDDRKLCAPDADTGDAGQEVRARDLERGISCPIPFLNDAKCGLIRSQDLDNKFLVFIQSLFIID